MNTTVESVVIGGGQAGLATSSHLNQRGREHIVLEQTARAGNAWRNDRFMAETGSDAPPESLPVLRDGYEAEEITELSLTSAGLTTVIWAMGYTFDFSLVKLPVFDSDGYPSQKRGVTEYPGLFFVGLPWLYKWKSGQFIGVGEDADFIASAIAGRK